MRRAALLLAAALTSLAPAAARAGRTRCWIDNGAVVAPAALGDIAGDFLFDLSASQSQLHLTRAQAAGVEGPALQATLRFAGERIPARFQVADLDARSWGFPTTINGLIGADVLAGYVIDLSFSPCRISLQRRETPEKSLEARPLATLPIRTVGGIPTVAASITDGRTALRGRFAIDTGTAGTRLSGAVASLSRTPKGIDPASRVRPPAHLAALGLGDMALMEAPAALANDLPAGVMGGIGDAVWARYDLRLDLRRGRLQLWAPARTKVSGRRSARSGDS